MTDHSEESGFPAAHGFAVEQQVLNLLGKFLEGRGEIEAVRLGHQPQTVNQILRRRAWAQAAIEQRLRPIDDDFGGIEIVAAAESVAFRAGSIGAVERERARLKLRNADAAIGAGEQRGIKRFLAVHDRDQNQPTAQLHGERDGKFEAMLNAGLDQQPIDDDFDGVILALVETESRLPG